MMSARGMALARAGGDHTASPSRPCSSEPCPPAGLVCVLAILHAMFFYLLARFSCVVTHPFVLYMYVQLIPINKFFRLQSHKSFSLYHLQLSQLSIRCPSLFVLRHVCPISKSPEGKDCSSPDTARTIPSRHV